MSSHKRLAAILGAAKIENLEYIAQNIGDFRSDENYKRGFAHEIAIQKITVASGKGVGLHSIDMLGFPFAITYQDSIYLAEVAAGQVIPDISRNKVNSYSRELLRQMKRMPFRSDGMIYFMPFMMNAKAKVRDPMTRILPVFFVDLNYDGKSLERRVWQYNRS